VLAAAALIIWRELRVIGLAAWRGLLELVNSSVLTHAASIAYFSLLSLFPFLLLIFSVVGTVSANPDVRIAIVDFVFQYFPRQFEFITGQIEAFEEETFPLGISGGLALVWASLGVFNAVSSAVNHAWGVEKHRSFLAHRLMSFVMMLSAGLVLGVALILASAVRVVQAAWFAPLREQMPWLLGLSTLLAGYIASALLVLCVALVFYFVPNTHVRFRDVWAGAIITGLLWQAAFSAFSWYAADLARWNVHGSIAAVVVFLLWVYVCAAILIYGVEMTASYARLKSAAEIHPGLV
jgi:membrane protein